MTWLSLGFWIGISSWLLSMSFPLNILSLVIICHPCSSQWCLVLRIDINFTPFIRDTWFNRNAHSFIHIRNSRKGIFLGYNILWWHHHVWCFIILISFNHVYVLFFVHGWRPRLRGKSNLDFLRHRWLFDIMI